MAGQTGANAVIACEYDDHLAQACIVLKPNRSWTWRANLWFVATLMTVSVVVAFGFTLQGAWLILPFTLLEMSILTACLYYCVRRTHLMEVLRMDREHLVFERGIRTPKERRSCQRYFARFFVRPARHPWYRKRIELCCRGQALEVGQFLTDEEKDELIRTLRTVIRRLEQPAGSMPLP